MVRLEQENTPDSSNLPLNDLGQLKNTQGLERASTPVFITMTEVVTTMQEGQNGSTFPLTHIKLHSPSAIIGTPLDPSSRFEYPFPAAQRESESAITLHHPNPLIIPPFGSASSVRRRQQFLHPKLEVQDVPVPPTLDRRMNIELRLPRPLEGVNLLGQAQAPIKRRAAVDVTATES